jgi:DNA-binding HxlR family transcriptional regulator
VTTTAEVINEPVPEREVTSIPRSDSITSKGDVKRFENRSTGMETPTEPSQGPARLPDTDADEAVVELLSLLGRTHALTILYAFARDPGPWRFGELQTSLDVPPNTLSVRLKELEAAGLLERRSYDEIPPRIEYTGTERASALKPAFARLYRWTRSHAFGRARP